MPDSQLTDSVATFWADFLAQTGRDDGTPLYDVMHFDDNEQDANQLAALVLSGTKRATASLLWQYDGNGKGAARVGDLSVVTDWAGDPLCVIETSAVEVKAFEDVDADFAAAEGEGDGSLRHWRTAHEAYFGRVCDTLGREPTARMEVVCERFRVVFPET